MASLHVIRTGQTTWELQQRLDSATGAPLTEEGVRQIADAARELVGRGIVAVFAGEGEAEKQTAALLAKALGVKARTRGELREFDYGLWQGLTLEELRRRQPKVCRQWMESPASVHPPEGETLEEAQKRIRRTIRGILRRHRDEAVLVVLRPIALGLLRSYLDGGGTAALWRHVEPDFRWTCFELDEKAL